MIEKNVIVFTNTKEQMQGIIRGIESLDKEHKIGIIHGTFGKTAVDEVTLILAELANALIIKAPNIEMQEHPQGKPIASIDVATPELDNIDDIINYVLIEYGDRLLEDILNS